MKGNGVLVVKHRNQNIHLTVFRLDIDWPIYRILVQSSTNKQLMLEAVRKCLDTNENLKN